jgi:hypothetical protein
MCANALSHSVPTRWDRIALFLEGRTPRALGVSNDYWNLAFGVLAPSQRLRVRTRSVQNGTFRDWDRTCHRPFLRKRTNFFGTSPILSGFAESVQNPYTRAPRAGARDSSVLGRHERNSAPAEGRRLSTWATCESTRRSRKPQAECLGKARVKTG